MNFSPSCDSVYLSISGYLIVPCVVVRFYVCVALVACPLVMCRHDFSRDTEVPPVLYMGLFDTVAAVGVPNVNDGVQAG